MSGEAAHLLAERRTPTATIDQSLSRFDIFPRIRFPFTKWQFLTISTSAAFRETYWTEQRNTKTGLNLEDPQSPRYVQTVWGFGYVFVPDGASAK